MIKKSVLIFKILTYIPIVWVIVFSSFIIKAKIVYKDISVFSSIPPYLLDFGYHFTVTYWITMLMLLTMVIGIALCLITLIMSLLQKGGREEMKKNGSMKAFLIVYFLILLFIQFDPYKLFYWIIG